MRHRPDTTNGQGAQIVEPMPMHVLRNPIENLARRFGSEVIHRAQLHGDRTGQEELQRVGWGRDPADADDRDAQFSRQLPDRLQGHRLDGRATHAPAAYAKPTPAPATLTMTGTSQVAQVGAYSRATCSTPGFWSPIALSMPEGVSAILVGAFPARGRGVVPLVTIAPSAERSTSGASKP